MTSKDFIKKKAQEIVETFNKARVRCEYDPLDNTYMLEITPLSIFKGIFKSSRMESRILKEFREAYPNEGLFTISINHPLVSITDAFLDVKGDFYGVQYSVNMIDSITTTKVDVESPMYDILKYWKGSETTVQEKASNVLGSIKMVSRPDILSHDFFIAFLDDKLNTKTHTEKIDKKSNGVESLSYTMAA